MDELGPLWEVVIDESATVHKVRSDATVTGLVVYLVADSWNGDDIFRVYDVRYVYLTEKGRDWFKANASEFISFEIAKLR